MSIFSQIENTKVGSNTFDLTHDRKLTTRFGRLTPVYLQEVIPGDRIQINSSHMIRFAPMVAPVMHRVKSYIHYFFVPNRIIWDGWEKFITGGPDGEDNTVWPHFNIDLSIATNSTSSLGDYLGLPTNQDLVGPQSTIQFSALPWAVYYKIWYDFYRDQNLQKAQEEKITSGSNGFFVSKWNVLRNRAWQHDYFTSALPFVQRGPEAILPFGDEATLKWNPWYGLDQQTDPPAPQVFRSAVGVPQGDADPRGVASGVDVGDLEDRNSMGPPHNKMWLDVSKSHYVDLSSAIGEASIINLRRAFKLQEFLEKAARGGARYIETINVMFGVKSSDQRLQRPEFLGGYSANVTVSEVLQLSQTEQNGTPQGNMAGHAISVGGGESVGCYAEEHGYIMGIMSIMPLSAYQQGVPRHMLRRDRFDYYWPSFAHIGEQAIERMELAVGSQNPQAEDQNQAVWGYTPRYSEYKYIPSTVHGDFKTSLEYWHLGRKFANMPLLNADFIECDADELSRIFAVQDGTDELWCHVLNEVKATRKMPYFGNPKF